ncbi:MAG: LamG-like jellyroll fold domain-containing protein [Verrucomicrobiia bacterium]
MKIKTTKTKAAILSAALVLGAIGIAFADEQDPSTNTVAYWKFSGTSAVVESLSGVGILDLATNVGQGTLNGSASNYNVLPSVDNLIAIGPVVTFPNDVPPAGMFHAAFNAGSASWDAGVDVPNGSEVYSDPTVSGNEWITPSFTEEVFFKTDYTNDPTLGTVKQTLIWNHQTSAYAEIQLNESAAGNTNDIGSLLFWAWNVVTFPTVRITAAQNGGDRFDDGQWHYVACRWNHATLTMDMFVLNQDGTTAESSSYLGAPLNPGNPAGGNFIVGNDEGGGTPLLGRINQVRFSQASLTDDKLLANVTGCVTPAFANPPMTNIVNVGASLNLSPAYQPLNMAGGPLLLQWQLNGNNVGGQTNINLQLYPVTVANSGAYTLVATTPCGGISATSAPIVVVGEPAVQLSRWGFNFTETNTYPQATVDDLIPGQSYDLITFNDAPNLSGIGANGEIALTNSVPPTTMFINGNNGSTNAFDSSYIGGVNGVVFYPAGPDVFDFQTSFSLELFFRSYNDQSGNGPMELICQGTDGGNTFRYGINLNQAAPGGLSFAINNFAIPPAGPAFEDTNAGIQSVVVTNANYADGNWHYLLAQYDSINNKISLSVANADNTGTSATAALPPGYGPLPNNFEGNLFVGRMRYPLGDDNRNFMGAIDEVQVSAGLVTPSLGQLGYLPAPPNITSISVSAGTVTIKFTGAPAALASSYSAVGSSTVNGTYSAVSAIVTALGGGNFQATLATSGPTEFYRIKH